MACGQSGIAVVKIAEEASANFQSDVILNNEHTVPTPTWQPHNGR